MTSTIIPIENALVLPQRFNEVQHRSVETVDVDDKNGNIRFRCAPYEEETQLGNELYEVFTRGAFAAAVNAPTRFRLFHEHRGPLVGCGASAEDLADGFYVNARFAATPAAQECRSLVMDGFLDSVSVEFRVMDKFVKATRRDNGVLVRHDKAHALGAAVVAYPAYELAQVVSVRDEQINREREERIARLRAFNA